MKVFLTIVGSVLLANSWWSYGVEAFQPAALCLANAGDCTAKFSGVSISLQEMQDLSTQLMDQSFDFLVLSSAFDHHAKNRPGFRKLYRKISDEAWSDSIELIKYQAKRGYQPAFNPNYKFASSGLRTLNDPDLASEHDSLKLAMEYEKQVATTAHALHKKVSVAHHKPAHYDPDVAHFMDEHIIAKRSESVRKLTGFIHVLDGILNVDSSTRDMGLHEFDEYLQSVV
ncbi:ferritin heavy chain-like [Uranotaenia lowii]|uniref:ferritin heavy chain-like n=1 Tax=Uranotaenia lowii TaxID=190385 RepID=UPI002478DC6F|nr:ferritin heavy chain-like [Uranotaenia lowii]